MKKYVAPFHCQRLFRIPHVHMATLKKEVDRLVEVGVLKQVDSIDEHKRGPWCAPSFIIPKKERFITLLMVEQGN